MRDRPGRTSHASSAHRALATPSRNRLPSHGHRLAPYLDLHICTHNPHRSKMTSCESEDARQVRRLDVAAVAPRTRPAQSAPARRTRRPGVGGGVPCRRLSHAGAGKSSVNQRLSARHGRRVEPPRGLLRPIAHSCPDWPLGPAPRLVIASTRLTIIARTLNVRPDHLATSRIRSGSSAPADAATAPDFAARGSLPSEFPVFSGGCANPVGVTP
jgi:hypothetical protein